MWTHASGAARRVGALAALSLLAAWLPTASAQEAGAANLPPLPSGATNPGSTSAEAGAVLERLRRMEERLDGVTKQNEDLRGRTAGSPNRCRSFLGRSADPARKPR